MNVLETGARTCAVHEYVTVCAARTFAWAVQCSILCSFYDLYRGLRTCEAEMQCMNAMLNFERYCLQFEHHSTSTISALA